MQIYVTFLCKIPVKYKLPNGVKMWAVDRLNMLYINENDKRENEKMKRVQRNKISQFTKKFLCDSRCEIHWMHIKIKCTCARAAECMPMIKDFV